MNHGNELPNPTNQTRKKLEEYKRKRIEPKYVSTIDSITRPVTKAKIMAAEERDLNVYAKKLEKYEQDIRKKGKDVGKKFFDNKSIWKTHQPVMLT